jgi:hypothetical protein
MQDNKIWWAKDTMTSNWSLIFSNILAILIKPGIRFEPINYNMYKASINNVINIIKQV